MDLLPLSETKMKEWSRKTRIGTSESGVIHKEYMEDIRNCEPLKENIMSVAYQKTERGYWVIENKIGMILVGFAKPSGETTRIYTPTKFLTREQT